MKVVPEMFRAWFEYQLHTFNNNLLNIPPWISNVSIVVIFLSLLHHFFIWLWEPRMNFNYCEWKKKINEFPWQLHSIIECKHTNFIINSIFINFFFFVVFISVCLDDKLRKSLWKCMRGKNFSLWLESKLLKFEMQVLSEYF